MLAKGQDRLVPISEIETNVTTIEQSRTRGVVGVTPEGKVRTERSEHVIRQWQNSGRTVAQPSNSCTEVNFDFAWSGTAS